MIQCKEAVAAAAALGIDPALLQRAEKRVAARNQQVSAALQTALEAEPFSSEAFGSCLKRAQRFGMHADVARAQRGLHLRRHRTASSLLQLTAGSGAAEVEAACSEAAELGLEAEARAALVRLEQRREAAAAELCQAADSGILQQYEVAGQHAKWIGVSEAAQQACLDQLRSRQQQAEEQLLQATEHGSAAAARECSQAALLLGLEDAVEAAEQRLNERRLAVAEQLAASTCTACAFASGQGGGRAQQLESWLSGAQQLADAIISRGVAKALAHLPPACAGWPAELWGWLEEARQASSLELEAAVAAASAILSVHLEALLDRARVEVLPLSLLQLACGSSGGGSWSGREPLSGRGEMLDSAAPSAACGPAEHLLACLEEWRTMQQGMLLLVAALSTEAADGQKEQCDEGAAAEGGCALDVSRQGLVSLELLAGSHSLTRLDISSNAIRSLEALSTLHALKDLHAGGNQLASVAGVEALRRLTALDLSGNQLGQPPSLEGASLRGRGCLAALCLPAEPCDPAAGCLEEEPMLPAAHPPLCRRADGAAPTGPVCQPPYLRRPAGRLPACHRRTPHLPAPGRQPAGRRGQLGRPHALPTAPRH